MSCGSNDLRRYLSAPAVDTHRRFAPFWSERFGGYRELMAYPLVFEMEGGTRHVYNGSWCSPGEVTSWNGSWRVSGEKGTALWDGDHDPVLDAEADAAAPAGPPHSGIAGALQVFVRALRTGEVPPGEVHENVMSLAMLEAAVRSATSGRLDRLDDVLEQAHAQARPDRRGADADAMTEPPSPVRGTSTYALTSDRPGYRCRHGHTSARSPDTQRSRNLYIREDHALNHITDLHHRLGLGIWAPEDLAERLRVHQLVITTNGATWTIEPAADQQAPDSEEAHPHQTRMSFVG